MSEESIPFKVGDVVKVRGVESPRMVVYEVLVAAPRPVPVANCFWFLTTNATAFGMFFLSMLEKCGDDGAEPPHPTNFCPKCKGLCRDGGRCQDGEHVWNGCRGWYLTEYCPDHKRDIR